MDYLPEFKVFKPSIKVLIEMGDKLEWIHSPELPQEEILRIKDYNTTIEQKQFEKGITYDKFTKYLKSKFQ